MNKKRKELTQGPNDSSDIIWIRFHHYNLPDLFCYDLSLVLCHTNGTIIMHSSFFSSPLLLATIHRDSLLHTVFITILHLSLFCLYLLSLMHRHTHHCLLLFTLSHTQPRVRIQHSSVAYFGLQLSDIVSLLLTILQFTSAHSLQRAS